MCLHSLDSATRDATALVLSRNRFDVLNVQRQTGASHDEALRIVVHDLMVDSPYPIFRCFPPESSFRTT